MALNVKALKLDKIGHFLLKKIGSLHIILKLYADIGTYLFFSRPSKKEKNNNDNQHPFFAIFLSKAKT